MVGRGGGRGLERVTKRGTRNIARARKSVSTIFATNCSHRTRAQVVRKNHMGSEGAIARLAIYLFIIFLANTDLSSIFTFQIE